MKKILIVIVILTSQYYAQNPEWVNLTKVEKVFSIVSSGNNLWMSTNGGLVKLNKETDELTFYNRANANLPDNHIRALAVDSSGYVWIGSQYNGIGKFDGNICQVYNTKNSALPDDQWNTEIEADNKGNIWIGSLRWICKLKGTDWQIYETGHPMSAYFSINDIFFDRTNTAWIAASWGVGRFIGDSVKIENIPGFNQGLLNEANVIQEDKKNHIWVGTQRNGLLEFDGTNWIEYDTTNSGLPGNYIYDMKFDSDGNLWMATGKGLVKFDGSNWIVYNAANSGLPEDGILSIEIDEKGIIWLGFFNYGLMKYDGINWKKYSLSNSILPSNGVYAIEFDNKDNVWIGTSGKALVNYDGNNWNIYDTTNSGLKSFVRKLEFDDKRESLWIGYYYYWNPIVSQENSWLAMYNNQNWLNYDSTNSPFSKISVYCLKTDSKDNLWIGSSIGLIKFDGINWTIYSKENTPLTSNEVEEIEFDKSGNLWCGLYYRGLAKFDGSTWNIYNSVLPNNDVRSIAVDSENFIWIGTPAGLTKFDGINWTTFNINNSPLTSNTIHDVTVDKDDNLWLSTSSGGLVKFDRKNNWKVYNVQNSGIAFDSQSLVAIDSYGNKWVGHNESGISIFREGGVILTDIKKDNLKHLPQSFTLYQNYPNPFNPSTTIKISIPRVSFVTLKIYNTIGQEVEQLVSKEMNAGTYVFNWNVGNNAAGVYYCRLTAGSFSETIKLVLLK